MLEKTFKLVISIWLLFSISGCYIEIAIKELRRYEQAFDSMKHNAYDKLFDEKGQ